MTQPQPALLSGLSPRVARLLRLARLVLWLEAAWPSVVWLASLAALFVALALFDVLPMLPFWLHSSFLLAVAGGVLIQAWRLLRVRSPSPRAAERRLEDDGGLRHRPFQALADLPVGGDGALWQAHQDRAHRSLAGARLSWPRSDMAARDPWGLRACALLLLAVALTGGWDHAGARLSRALSVAWPDVGIVPQGIQVWITPPAYTALPPVSLQGFGPGPGLTDPVSVPAGSSILALVSGGWGRASLDNGIVRVDFQSQGEHSQRAESVVDLAQDRLEIRHWGRVLASWPLAVSADLPPVVSFIAPPQPAERGRLQVSVQAADDYGVDKIWLDIRRADDTVDAQRLRVEIPLPGRGGKQVSTTAWLDLTAHPWAGLPVRVRPLAQDGQGHVGVDMETALVLPERKFLNPSAQALIEQRQLLTQSRTNAPGAMGVLDRLSVFPASFNDDLVVFLALRMARHALADPDFDLTDLQDVLWQTALRLEDGDLSAAERDMEQARQDLRQALEQGADPAVLDRLLTQFQAALQRYLSALAERAGPQNPTSDLGEGDSVSAQDFQSMLESMRDLAGIGARDGLRQMLDRMSSILDRLQAGPPSPPSAATLDALRSLRDMVGKQQRLQEQSHLHSQGKGETQPAAAARAQQDLAERLGQIRKTLQGETGQDPTALGEAAQAMDDAAQALRQGEWGRAAQAQGRALDGLGQGLRQGMQALPGGRSTGMGLTGPQGRDPLGRPGGMGAGAVDDGTTRVPDQGERQRVRAILEEVRRRAGDYARPQDERDYLQRLLRQF